MKPSSSHSTMPSTVRKPASASCVATAVETLIMNCGSLLSAGFDQIFNLYNANVYETADIIDTYVYRRGIGNMEYNVSTAVGLFKNLLGFFMVMGTNYLAKLLGEEGIW